MACTCRFSFELYMVKSSFGCAVRLLGLLKRYVEHIRNRSQYPKEFPRLFTVSYSAAEKILAVEGRLPKVERVVRGRAPRSQKLSKTKIDDTDDVLYQMCLRTVYEVCKADLDDLVSILVLNGWGVELH